MQSVATAIFEYKSIVALCFVMLSKRLLVDEINHYNSTKKCNKIDHNCRHYCENLGNSRYATVYVIFINANILSVSILSISKVMKENEI